MEKDTKEYTYEHMKSELLDHALKFDDEKKCKEIINLIFEADKFKDKPIALLFIGDTCAGKTTLINSILAHFKLKGKNLEMYQDYSLLKSAYTENTFRPTIIEYSPSYYILEKGRKQQKILFSEDEALTKIKKYFEDNDKKALKILTKSKTLNFNKQRNDLDEERIKKNEEDFNSSKEYTDSVIHLGLPWMDEKIIIVDLPGASGKSTTDVIERLLENNVIIPVVIYLKNLEERCAINENLNDLLEEIKKKFEKVYVSLVFTKSDHLENVLFPNSEVAETPEEIEQRKEELKNTIRFFIDAMNEINIEYISVDFLNPVFYLSKNPKQEHINTLSNFLKFVINFALSNRDYILYDTIKMILKTSIRLIFSKEKELTESDIVEIKKNAEERKKEFKDYLQTFFDSFPQDNKELKEKYPELYDYMIFEIDKSKENLIKKTKYLLRHVYINDQVKENVIKFAKKINEKYLCPQMEETFISFHKGSNDKISNVIDNLINGIEFQESSDLIKRILFLKSLLKKYGIFVAVFMSYTLVKSIIFKILEGVTDVLLFFDRNYYENCREEILMLLIKNYMNNKEKILEEVPKMFSTLIDEIIKNLEELKKKCDQEKKFIEIIKKHKIKDVHISLNIYELTRNKLKNSENEFLNQKMKNFFKEVLE